MCVCVLGGVGGGCEREGFSHLSRLGSLRAPKIICTDKVKDDKKKKKKVADSAQHTFE